MKDKLLNKKYTFNKLPIIIKQQHKIHTLQNEVETLKYAIKDELYKEFMKRLDEPMEVNRYKKENKKLRQHIKSLKEIIKD